MNVTQVHYFKAAFTLAESGMKMIATVKVIAP